MSYSETDAVLEYADRVFQALNTRDSEELYKLAEEVKEEGDDEEAERLLKVAKQIDKEDRGHDELNNN